MGSPNYYDDVEACIDALLSAVGKKIVLGIPLGAGKPNRFVNALYRRAAGDRSLNLTIFTALTPAVPTARGSLDARFLEPLAKRLYGEFEPFEYVEAVLRDALPPNIDVSEFFFSPGYFLGSPYAQRHHVSANYSDVTQALIDRGVNAVAQSVARRDSDGGTGFSLGTNPDLTLDLVREMGPDRRPFMIGQVSDAMPFMVNDAETRADFWDAIVDERGNSRDAPLFCVPNQPVGLADYAIATHVTSLIEDGGTLQIGIGSLGDAIAHVMRLRHIENAVYRALAGRLIGEPQRSLRARLPVADRPFEQGLYSSGEMLVEGLLHLIDAGVLKRTVAANADPSREIVLHAAFLLGSPELYRRLHAMSERERGRIEMTGVRFVNTLDDDFALKCRQRQKARFVNSAMMVALDGAVVSDGLADKRVVSGVGGQHDFVAMATRLPGARSIIVLPSTRMKAGRARSNIVFDYAHTTVPRQFRDIVVTEYGAADLRGASDRDVMVRLLGICDTRFQASLLERAKASGKVERAYRIPEALRANLPQRLDERISAELRAHLPHFPLSSDFGIEEARAAVALDFLKDYAGSWLALGRLLLSSRPEPAETAGVLERMNLMRVRKLAERLDRRVLIAALARTSGTRPLF